MTERSKYGAAGGPKRPRERTPRSKPKPGLFEHLIGGLDAAVYVKDQDLRFFLVNEALADLMGRPREELLGRTDFDLYSAEQAKRIREKETMVLQTGAMDISEDRLVWDDRPRTVSTRRTRVEDPETGRPYVVGAVRDITGQKILADFRRKYEFIVNTSREFMTLIDRNYVYEAANDAYCRAHDRPREEIVGTTVPRIWGEELFRTLIKGHLDRCFTGREVSYEAWFRFNGRPPRLYAVVYYPYINPAGEVTHVVVISRDITDQWEADRALKRQSDINTAVADLSEAILSTNTLEEIGRLVLRYALQLTRSPRGFVGRIDPDTGGLDALAGGLGEDRAELVDPVAFSIPILEGDWADHLERRRPVLSNDPEAGPAIPYLPAGQRPRSGYLTAPAAVREGGDRLIGQITVMDADDGYAPEDRVVLERLAPLYAIAIWHHQMEAEHLKKEKLQGILEVAGAVCHELNQPLQILSGYTELLLKNVPDDHPLHGKARGILKQVDRIGMLTKKLMGITRCERKSYVGDQMILDIDRSSG